jgi:hypothetical protein
MMFLDEKSALMHWAMVLWAQATGRSIDIGVKYYRRFVTKRIDKTFPNRSLYKNLKGLRNGVHINLSRTSAHIFCVMVQSIGVREYAR